jgi:hypothetical protein
VIFNVRIRKDFGLKNSVFYIRTVLIEDNRFLCIFSFPVLIVNDFFIYFLGGLTVVIMERSNSIFKDKLKDHEDRWLKLL